MKKFLLLILLSFVGLLHAQSLNFEKNPVKVIIPFPPGGGTDLAFKHFQKYAIEKHGITIVPIYKPGADSLIGLSELADSTNDGSVIGIVTIAGLANYKIKNPEYQFDYVSSLGKTTMAVVVNPLSGINTIEDLEKEVKSVPQKKYYGFGAPAQKVALTQLFTVNNATTPEFIPYKGAAPLITDLLGGHIHVAIVPLSTVKTQIDNGKLILIASTNKQYGTNLKQRYSHWETHEGFVLTLPKNSDKIAYNRWAEITRAYLNDSDTEKYWNEKFLEGVAFGPSHVKKDVDSAAKRVN